MTGVLIDPAHLGRWVAQQRRHLRWNQAALAVQMAVHRNTVSRWENGDAPLTLAEFVQLCTVFNLNVAAALRAVVTASMLLPAARTPLAPKKQEKGTAPTMADLIEEGHPSLEALLAERDPALVSARRRA